MDKPPFRVSDHAVLRFMERAMGLNVEMVREHIAGICSGYAAAGASCLRKDGLRFEMANNTVVTVSPDDGNLSKTHKDRPAGRNQKDARCIFPRS